MCHQDLGLCPDDFRGHLDGKARKELSGRVYTGFCLIGHSLCKAGTTALSSVTSVEPEGLCLSSMSRREWRLLVHSGLEYIPSLAGAVGPSEDRTNNPLEPFPETHFSRSQEEIQVIHFGLINNRHIPVGDMGESVRGRLKLSMVSQCVKIVQGCGFPVLLPFRRLGPGDIKQMWIPGLQKPTKWGLGTFTGKSFSIIPMISRVGVSQKLRPQNSTRKH